jgi:hypothetical protein
MLDRVIVVLHASKSIFTHYQVRADETHGVLCGVSLVVDTELEDIP